MGVTFGMDKKERVQTHASGSSHAMTLIAVDLCPETGKCVSIKLRSGQHSISADFFKNNRLQG